MEAVSANNDLRIDLEPSVSSTETASVLWPRFFASVPKMTTSDRQLFREHSLQRRTMKSDRLESKEFCDR